MVQEWRVSNNQPYLYVEAKNRVELGLGTGLGLYKQIEFMQNHIKQKEIAMKLDNSDKFEQYTSLVEQYISATPEPDKAELEGMCAGANKSSLMDFTVHDILKQNAYLEVVYQLMARNCSSNSVEGCTNFASANVDGTITHGQNYDTDLKMSPSYAFVHHKLPNEPECFIFRKGADLGTATGKNSEGVLITVSVVDTCIAADVMQPRSVLVRNALRQSNAIKANACMVNQEGKAPFSYNLIISDKERVIASQSTPYETRNNYVKNWVAQSNQYDYHDWIKYMTKPAYSKLRQQYSERIISEFYSRYGKISEEDLLQILGDEPIILRYNPNESIGSTVLFITRNHFGLGNVKQGFGTIPI